VAQAEARELTLNLNKATESRRRFGVSLQVFASLMAVLVLLLAAFIPLSLLAAQGASSMPGRSPNSWP
jgi:hypothetical protein